MNWWPTRLSPEVREYYFRADQAKMVRLLTLGAMLPLVLSIGGYVTGFDPMFVVVYNLVLAGLIGTAALIAHRLKHYVALDRFCWCLYIILLPVFVYLRYTGIIDEERAATVAVDILLDLIIIFVSYTAFSLSPGAKAIGTSVFAVSVLIVYGTHVSAIPDGAAGLTTIVIAYSLGSLLGYGNAVLVDQTRLVAFNSISQEQALNAALNHKNEELSEALEKVKALSGMLPICAGCKKIRDDDGYYTQIEEFITAHSEAEFTHGICPECSERLYSELED